jgi:hypothetical protein
LDNIFKHIANRLIVFKEHLSFVKLLKIIPLLAIVLFYSCQNHNDPVSLYGTLRIQVVDANGTPLPFTKVGAFNSDVYANGFLSLFDNYNFAGAGRDTGTTDKNGYVVLDSLTANQSYLIMAHNRQPGTLFSQYYIDYDNYDGDYVLPIQLQGSTVINIRIKVAPANAWVVFWTDANNSGILPIEVKATALQLGSISGTNTSPQIQSPGNYVVTVRKGYQKFYGLFKPSACVWTVDTNVVANTFMFVKFGTCDNKVVSFYASDSLTSDKFPISVTLGENQVIGTVQSGTSGFTSVCGGSNMISANLSPGNYTYFARSAAGDCYWTGSFTVGSSACQVIRFGNCTP